MFEKISQKSEDYTQTKETNKMSVEDGMGVRPYGGAFLSVMNGRENMIKDILKEKNVKPVYVQYIKQSEKWQKDQNQSLDYSNPEEVVAFLRKRNEETLQLSFDNFVKLKNNSANKDPRTFILGNATRNRLLKAQIAVLVSEKDFFSNTIVPETIKILDQGKFSLELWYRILKNNERLFWQDTEKFKEEMLPKLKERFLQSALIAIEEGVLPFSEESVRKALDEVAFALIDATEAHLENIGGRYSADDNTIFLASYLIGSHLDTSDYLLFRAMYPKEAAGYATRNADRMDRVFCHEVVHLLSGKTIVGNEEDSYTEYEHKKIGLMHLGIEMDRFRWLNEALTECISVKLMNKEGSMHYVKERALFELLMTEGKVPIPIKFFTDAFFESFEPDQPKEQQLQNWKTLRAKLGEAYDHDFIVRLDRVIQEKGIDQAIEMVKKFNK